MRFGPFEFDPETGELWSVERGRHPVGRLPPQPARLLAHLIERRPQLVTQEEIRALLWAEVAVEFEESLYSCVRRIRTTLGDSATTPLYVETVPRRGYRFIGTIQEPVGECAAVPAPDVVATRVRRWPLMAGALVIAIIALVALSRSTPSLPVASTPSRIAVMPFEPVAADSVLEPDNDLAEGIVRHLVERRGASIEVVGPTTTDAYTGRVRELIADFGMDYVVNARETMGDAGPRLLVEVIRAGDGAHVWVRYLDELPAGRAAEMIAAAVQ